MPRLVREPPDSVEARAGVFHRASIVRQEYFDDEFLGMSATASDVVRPV